MQVEVRHSYYLGSHYRIYGILDSGRGVVFDAEAAMDPGVKVYLNVSLETINKRMPI